MTTACWWSTASWSRRRAARRARRRRRRAHDRAAHRHREPGPAPRRRPREGADAAGARRAGAQDAGARRAHTPSPCPPAGRSCRCAGPPTSRPAAPPPMSPTSSTPTTARWPCARSRAIGLDVGGVDFLSPGHHARATASVGGGICEVNAAPGFRMHVAPSEGTPRDVAGAGDRHAVPARLARARADRRDHRHQRQDHDRAHAGAHRQDGRLHARPHHHRRRLHRRRSAPSPAT